MHKYNKNGEQQKTFRPIRAYNCYHWENAIVLGVSKPRYSNDELQKIMDRNETGFDFEGEHYSMYQGTQLQRKIELEVRKQKDMQIMARAGDNEQLAMESQTKINQLTQKYKELNQASGLKPKLERLSASGYHKINVKINKNDFIDFKTNDFQDERLKDIGKKYFDFPTNNSLQEYVNQREGIARRMKESDEYKEKMLNIAEDIEQLKKPSEINFVAYVGHEEGLDLRNKGFAISSSISEGIARGYKLRKGKNAEVSKIYIQKGADIISTYNTKNKQFNVQGEIIIPMNNVYKLVKLNKNEYLYTK